jgi:probable HAF family extracellular repeat protein
MKKIIFILLNVFLALVSLSLLKAIFSQNNRLAAPGETVKIIDLGTLGGEASQASDLNYKGEVVGRSELAAEDSRAFFWFEGIMTPLSAPRELTTSAYSINESGTIAGETISNSGAEEIVKPTLWIGDTYKPLLIGENIQGTARAVNDEDVAAGHTLGTSNNNILIWENETLVQTIPTAGGLAQVNSLNNQKQIVGFLDNGSTNNAFLWQEGAFENLGTLGGEQSIAHNINDKGMVVGEASLADESATHAFLWQGGVMSDLGTIGNFAQTESRALGINAAGVIVGQAQVGEALHAVIWENGQIADLNTYLPAGSAWEVLITAVSINDRGWIVGTGLIDGQEHAFLLIPPLDNFSYLPIVVRQIPTPTSYDLARYIQGDGRLYEVQFKGDLETQARHQTQFSGSRFYHTKGNEFKAEWEELWNDSDYIYRGTDTSPGSDAFGNELFYSLYDSMQDYLDGNVGSAWNERYMGVGNMYFRKPYVVFFYKSDCTVARGGYLDPSWLKFQDFHNTYTFDTGLTIKNVVELAWLQGDESGPTQPVDERYFYAEGYGLVGWQKPSLGWRSAIIEEFSPGGRPDNLREEIGCLNNKRFKRQPWSPKLNTGPLPESYASMVKP